MTGTLAALGVLLALALANCKRASAAAAKARVAVTAKRGVRNDRFSKP